MMKQRLAALLLLSTAMTGASSAATPTFSVRVNVTGLAAQAVLQNNGQNDLTLHMNGLATFSVKVATGKPFNVTVRTQPSFPAQTCAIGNGSGTINGADVDVAVSCRNLTIPRLVATANVHRAALTWNQPSDATGYDLYISSAPNCDVRNYASCPNGALLTNVGSPREVDGLPNDQPRYFILETRYKNGTRGLSPETGARPSGVVFGGFVHAIATVQDKVFVGGAFTAAGISSGSAVPIERDTGQPIIPTFPVVTGDVFAIEPDLQSGFWLGGTFTAVGGVPRANLAHILPDGTVDPNFNPGANGSVTSLALVKGRLYAGGGFTSIGGQARTGLAALDGNGVVATWNPVVGSFNPVKTIAGLNDRIFVGGNFSTVNGQPRRSLAAFNAVNAASQPGALSAWTADINGELYDLHVASNTLYVGGSFSTIGGQARNSLAAFALDTVGNPTALLPLNKTLAGSVAALALSGNTLYIGQLSLSALDAASGATIRTLVTTGGDVKTLLAFAGKIYVGGSFNSLGGVARLNLAAVDPPSGTVLPWDPSPNRFVFTLGGFNRTVYAGGAFSGINAVRRERLAQLDAGGLLTSWNPSADSHVLDIAPSASGQTIYVGGYFTKINGLPHVGLAALDANGAAIETFNHPSVSTQLFSSVFDTPSTKRVNAIVLTGDKVFAGGWFASGIAAYNSVDAPASPGVRLNWSPAISSVHTLAVGTDQQLYVGGSFTTAAGQPRLRLAAYALDGASGPGVLTGWDPGADGAVFASTLRDGIVYVGGEFQWAYGVPHQRLAAFDFTGLPQGWQPGANGAVQAIRNFGNTLLVAGEFTVAAGAARPYVASIHPNGTINTAFNANADGSVFELAVASNGAVYVAGGFGTIGGQVRDGFAKLNPNGSAD